ncbi:MAG: hypothetical protein ACYTGQ_15630 [Planctomycetota bacterium]
MSAQTMLQVYEIVPMPEEVENPMGFSPNDMVTLIKENPAYLAFTWVGIVWTLVKTIGFFAASIGMFKLVPGARTATVVLAVITLAFNIVNGFVTHQLITIPLIEQIAETADEQTVNAVRFGVKVGIWFQAIPLIYYGLMIFILTRRSVRGAFAPIDVQPEVPPETLQDNERNTQ